MIEKKHRLTKRKEFGYIYKKGEAKHTNNLTLLYTPTYLKTFKVGFSISKKVGKAYQRNLVKRRLREAFKTMMNNVDVKYNYVIIAKPTILDQSYQNIKQELFQLFKKSGRIINE